MQLMHRIALPKMQTFLWFALVCGLVSLTIPPQTAGNSVSAYDLPHGEKEKKETHGERSEAIGVADPIPPFIRPRIHPFHNAFMPTQHRAILDALCQSMAELDAVYPPRWKAFPSRYEVWYKGAA